jgi:hypothetical protein
LAIGSSLSNIGRYLVNIGFTARSGIDYLPPGDISAFGGVINGAIYLICATLLVAVSFFVPIVFWREIVRTKRIEPVNLLLLLMLIAIWISMAFNKPKGWYDAGYIYALLLAVGLILMRENFSGIIRGRVAYSGFALVAIVSILSQTYFIVRFLPAFRSGYEGPGVSLVKHDQDAYSAQLGALEKSCGIDSRNSRKLIIDDHTYFRYKDTSLPMAITYITFFMDSEFLSRQFIATSSSDGLITRCRYIPPYLYRVTRRDGDFCCVSKENLSRIN